MNYYGSRRRNYRLRPRYSRYYSRYPRSSSTSVRRASGNYRAALQQRDQSSVNLSIPTSITLTTKDILVHNPFEGVTGSTFTIENGGVTAINVWDLLRKSSFYQSYANMYDQIKLDRIRIKLTPSSFTLSGSSTNYNNYTVVTAWDRSGLSEEQLTINTENTYDPLFGSSPGNENQGLYIKMSAEEIASYSSAVTKPVNSGANSTIIRTLYPRTTQEKGLYINTADIDEWYQGLNPENNNWYGVKNKLAIQSQGLEVTVPNNQTRTVALAGTLNVIDSKAVARNPCFIGESPTLPWKPTLLIGLLNKPYQIATGDNNQMTTINPKMTLYVEADIGVSFRGLRKAPVVKYVYIILYLFNYFLYLFFINKRSLNGIDLPIKYKLSNQPLVVHNVDTDPSPVIISTKNEKGQEVEVVNMDVSSAKALSSAKWTSPLTVQGANTVGPFPYPVYSVDVTVDTPPEPPLITKINLSRSASSGALAQDIMLDQFIYNNESKQEFIPASTYLIIIRKISDNYIIVIYNNTAINESNYQITINSNSYYYYYTYSQSDSFSATTTQFISSTGDEIFDISDSENSSANRQLDSNFLRISSKIVTFDFDNM